MTTERLATVLEALARFQGSMFSDERSAEYDKNIQAMRDAEAAELRAQKLARQRVPLTPTAHAAIVSGSGLRPLLSLRAAQRWLTRPDAPGTLVLVGGTGCGKSVAAGWVIANGPASNVYRSANDTVRVFAGFFGEAAEQQDLMCSCKLLVLDDVATELDAERMCAALVEIVEKRKGLRTLITTNANQADWVKRYPDERLHSRLRECAVFVTDTGADMRGAK